MVLDLGSGGGIDVLLFAKRVGPTGKAFGLDMTDEMLALARENQRKRIQMSSFSKAKSSTYPFAGQLGRCHHFNCVINLSGDKDRVLSEAFRVLKPGGRFAVSHVVVRGEVPAEVRRSMELWVGCIAGALEHDDYLGQVGSAPDLNRHWPSSPPASTTSKTHVTSSPRPAFRSTPLRRWFTANSPAPSFAPPSHNRRRAVGPSCCGSGSKLSVEFS